jgi:hypothetical protein
MADCKPEVHCISVNTESLFAVVTVRKLISVAIVRTLTTDDSAVMFVYDYDTCQESKLLYRLMFSLVKLLVSECSLCRAMSAVSPLI